MRILSRYVFRQTAGALVLILVSLTGVTWIAVALRQRATGRDLLALRALTRQPLRRLVAIHPDPATAWRDHDTKALDSLAALELRTLGLRGWPPDADAAAAAATRVAG